eukprot:12711079-Heterocapsa_arctica.AAC.1
MAALDDQRAGQPISRLLKLQSLRLCHYDSRSLRPVLRLEASMLGCPLRDRRLLEASTMVTRAQFVCSENEVSERRKVQWLTWKVFCTMDHVDYRAPFHSR